MIAARHSSMFVILLSAACASGPAPLANDPVARQLHDAVAMHGWACGDVVTYERTAPRLFMTRCSNGRIYEVFLREDWDWRETTRQTELHLMLEIADEVERLKADDGSVRRSAAEALGALGAAAGPAVQALSEALRDEDAAVRRAAAQALVAIGATSAHPALEGAAAPTP